MSMGDPNLPLWVKCLTGGAAAIVAEVITIPLDTAKVRLQIQGSNLKPGEIPKYKGMLHTVVSMIKEEKITAPWKGTTAGIQRQIVYGSLRIGLYEPVRNLCVSKERQNNPPLISKIIAGIITGTIGITVANPTDVIKIRLQAEGNLPPGVPKRYSGVIDAYIKIIRSEGLQGLWTGLGPNIARNSIINAAELSTYDQAKETVLKYNLMKDNIFCHFFCSATAGFIATVIGSPIDVVKTRIMNAKKSKGSGQREYNNVIDCFIKTYKKEGLQAFYNGFSSNASRIISWNIIMFMCLQQFRSIASSYRNKY